MSSLLQIAIEKIFQIESQSHNFIQPFQAILPGKIIRKH